MRLKVNYVDDDESQMKIMSIVVFLTLTGCATSIKSIDVSGKDPGCVRQCTQGYSTCAASGSQIGFRTETLQACADSYQVCTQTCPAK